MNEPTASIASTARIERLNTPLGPMLLVRDAAQHVLALDWEDASARLAAGLRRFHGVGLADVPAAAGASLAAQAIGRYFDGDVAALDALAVAPAGSAFQAEVWRALRAIVAGSTTGYGALAAAIGRPGAARAVGAANGSNPVCLIVPCHRVIGADGSLTGYAGGLARKRWLLEHEAAWLTARPAASQAGRAMRTV